MKKTFYTLSALILIILLAAFAWANPFKKSDEKVVKAIFNEALANGESYDNLEYLCKQIGGRLSGSPQAAAAVEWAKQTLDKLPLDTVWLQPTMVPHWERGEKEHARIISEHIGWQEVNVCALGNSVGTPKWGITAPVIEITDLKQLKELGRKNVEGKIVFHNRHMPDTDYDTFESYSTCVGDRYDGAPEAAKYGAVGFVLRSLGHFVDEHPHTGNMAYIDGVEKIPAAAISTRDANYLHELLEVDTDLSFNLRMHCKTYPDKLSYNVIGEIRGSEFPEEVIVVSGHLDAWDNGEGAHDDGSGTVHSIESLRILSALDLRPKRTIRCVLYMNEENGTRGARTYTQFAKDSDEKCILAIESDSGAFTPRGFTVDAKDSLTTEAGVSSLRPLVKVMESYGLHKCEKGFSGVDIQFLKELGTVCVGLSPDPQRYFDYHHTPNDTFDKINKRELELGAASVTALAYLVAQQGL